MTTEGLPFATVNVLFASDNVSSHICNKANILICLTLIIERNPYLQQIQCFCHLVNKRVILSGVRVVQPIVFCVVFCRL